MEISDDLMMEIRDDLIGTTNDLIGTTNDSITPAVSSANLILTIMQTISVLLFIPVTIFVIIYAIKGKASNKKKIIVAIISELAVIALFFISVIFKIVIALQ